MRPEPTPARRFASFAIWAGVIGGGFLLALVAWSDFGLALSDSSGAYEHNLSAKATGVWGAIACGVLLVAGVVTRIVDDVVSSRRGR
jgi:hypothetical protein